MSAQDTSSSFDTPVFGTATERELILAAVGGLLIAGATSLNLYVKGRITGMSGILNALVTLNKDTLKWKLSIFLGMLVASSIFYLFLSSYYTWFEPAPAFQTGTSVWGFIFAGFLVGFGTRLANGCTSGHGICGLPRLSKRSIVAVVTFIASATLIANLLYNVFDKSFITESSNMKQIGGDKLNPSPAFAYTIFGVSLLGFIGLVVHEHVTGNELTKVINVIDCLVSFAVGILFATGLIVGGVSKRHIVLGFLVWGSQWNPILLVLFLVAVIANFIAFRFILKQSRPVFNTSFQIPEISIIDGKLIGGAVLFGLGWGIAGICPGPAFTLIPQFLVESVFFFFIPLAIGNGIATYLVPGPEAHRVPLKI